MIKIITIILLLFVNIYSINDNNITESNITNNGITENNITNNNNTLYIFKDITNKDIFIRDDLLYIDVHSFIDINKTNISLMDINNTLIERATYTDMFVIKNIKHGLFILNIHLVDIYGNNKKFNFIRRF